MNTRTRLRISLAATPLFLLAPLSIQAQESTTAQPVVETHLIGAPATPTTSTPLPAVADSTARTVATNGGPVAQSAALKFRVSTSDTPAPVPQASRTNATAMMVVGLAAVVVGVAVGDDAGTILVLAGSGIGLYGLYKFLQ